MNRLIILIILAMVLYSGKVYAGSDSLIISANASLMGSWQTGNLNQLGITPEAAIRLSNSTFSSNVNVTYSYLKVEGFTVLNDFWSNAGYRFKPENKVYPLLAAFYGFAHSYRINQALVGGAGAGWAPLKPSDLKLLELSAFAGYMDFEFETEATHRAPAFGTILVYKTSINGYVSFEWTLKTYHSFTEKEYWGANNSLSLTINLARKLHLKMSYNWLYNDKTVPEVKKTNTLMLIGVQYNFKK